MIKRNSDRNRTVTEETKNKHVGESQEIGEYDVSHQTMPDQASKTRIHQDPELQGHSLRYHHERSYVQARRDAREFHSLPMVACQTSKQLRRRAQTKRSRTRQTHAEVKKLENLSQLKKMDGEMKLTRRRWERMKLLPPIRIRNVKGGNKNLDLIRQRNNFKFSKFSVSTKEEDLQHGITSGLENDLDREEMKCDVIEKNDNESKNRDDAKCPNAYPVVCPINYFVCLNKKQIQS